METVDGEWRREGVETNWDCNLLRDVSNEYGTTRPREFLLLVLVTGRVTKLWPAMVCSNSNKFHQCAQCCCNGIVVFYVARVCDVVVTCLCPARAMQVWRPPSQSRRNTTQLKRIAFTNTAHFFEFA